MIYINKEKQRKLLLQLYFGLKSGKVVEETRNLLVIYYFYEEIQGEE